MGELLARCGYRCDLCPAFYDNLKSDNDRRTVSDGWFKYGGFRVKPDDINCSGCQGTNKTLDNECPVLPCVVSKNIPNCGFCREMPCEILKTRMNFFEDRLKDLSEIPPQEYNKFIRPYLSREVLIKINAGIGKAR
jgi:hypothetical protein